MPYIPKSPHSSTGSQCSLGPDFLKTVLFLALCSSVDKTLVSPIYSQHPFRHPSPALASAFQIILSSVILNPWLFPPKLLARHFPAAPFYSVSCTSARSKEVPGLAGCVTIGTTMLPAYQNHKYRKTH